MKRTRVLVTGAAGRIGSAFVEINTSRYDLRLADLRTEGMPTGCGEVLKLDITDFQSCLAACAQIDAVVHLAADASPGADFVGSLLQNNIVGAYNMFLAAKQQQCTRFVFASSAQAVEGYPLDVQVHEDMPPRPRNLYGVSKAFGEGLASYFALDGTMSTIAVRIANVAEFKAGEQHSDRDTAAFISVRDVVALLVQSIEAPITGFHVVHGVSNNRFKRLAIEKTRALLGFKPLDDAFAILEGN